jgi:hypothetical protein
MGFFSLASGHGFLPHAQLAATWPEAASCRFGGARLQYLLVADMRRGMFVGSRPAKPERRRRTGRGQTVTKPLALKRLELLLSEKQIPQVVENLESGGKTKEALETARLPSEQLRSGLVLPYQNRIKTPSKWPILGCSLSESRLPKLLKNQGQDRGVGGNSFASGAKGRWFESTRAYHLFNNLRVAPQKLPPQNDH